MKNKYYYFVIAMATFLITYSLITLAADDYWGGSGNSDKQFNLTPNASYTVPTKNATVTEVTMKIGDQTYTARYEQGEGVEGTPYQGYNWKAGPDRDLNTSNEEIAKLAESFGVDAATVEAIRNGQSVAGEQLDITIDMQPLVKVDGPNGREYIPVNDLVETCAAYEAELRAQGVSLKGKIDLNGDGIVADNERNPIYDNTILNVYSFAKTVQSNLTEESPLQYYPYLVTRTDGKGQVVHQIKLEPPPPVIDSGDEEIIESGEEIIESGEDEIIPSGDDPIPSGDDPIPSGDEKEEEEEEEEEEEDPIVTPDFGITPGIALDGGGYTAAGKIDDDNTNPKFQVLEGGPIPVKENLDVTVGTNLYGAMENLGQNTVEFYVKEYSATAGWLVEETYQSGWEQEEIEILSGDEWVGTGEYQDARDENGDRIPVYSTRYYGDSYTKKKDMGGEMKYIKIRPDTNSYTADGIVVLNTTLPSAVFDIPGISFIPVYQHTGSEESRVSGSRHKDLGTFTTSCTEDDDVAAICAQMDSLAETTAQSFINGATVEDYWSVITDVVETSDGENVERNGTFSRSYAEQVQRKVIPSSVKNLSISGAYPTTAYHTFVPGGIGGGSKSDYSIAINPVKIHTPIYNEIVISSNSINQLDEDGMHLPAGDDIIKLGDRFSVGINTYGYTYYYGNMNTAKYISSYSINCPFCGTINSQSHSCTVPETAVDNMHYTITSKVEAVNGPGDLAQDSWNQPDNIYALANSDSIYVVGKIYDMQVRTTDDTGWELNSAQKLDQMPIGEVYSSASVVENAKKLYKYAIKLGYRAYFDFKTLGVASTSVDLKPNLYYVDANGNVDTNVDFYFKTSPTQYTKLVPGDVIVKMNFNATKGDVNNAQFINEKVQTVNKKGGIDFSKVLDIGKLTKLSLANDNWLQSTRLDNEKRWYAEIYMPSSTVVATKGTSTTDVANGKNVKKTGYIIITFADVVSKLSDGTEYLQYSMARDQDGTELYFNKSIMYAEKNGKNSIALPGGKTFTAYNETEMPVIVYDVTLKARNDYETSGTY